MPELNLDQLVWTWICVVDFTTALLTTDRQKDTEEESLQMFCESREAAGVTSN